MTAAILWAVLAVAAVLAAFSLQRYMPAPDPEDYRADWRGSAIHFAYFAASIGGIACIASISATLSEPFSQSFRLAASVALGAVFLVSPFFRAEQRTPVNIVLNVLSAGLWACLSYDMLRPAGEERTMAHLYPYLLLAGAAIAAYALVDGWRKGARLGVEIDTSDGYVRRLSPFSARTRGLLMVASLAVVLSAVGLIGTWVES